MANTATKEENSKAIRELCEKYHLTQTNFSRRFGIPLRTVQGWFLGERKVIDYNVAIYDRYLALETKTDDALMKALKNAGIAEDALEKIREDFFHFLTAEEEQPEGAVDENEKSDQD